MNQIVSALDVTIASFTLSLLDKSPLTAVTPLAVTLFLEDSESGLRVTPKMSDGATPLERRASMVSLTFDSKLCDT